MLVAVEGLVDEFALVSEVPWKLAGRLLVVLVRD